MSAFVGKSIKGYRNHHIICSSNGKKGCKVARVCLSELRQTAGRFSLYLPSERTKTHTHKHTGTETQGDCIEREEDPKRYTVCLRSSSYTLHCVCQSVELRENKNSLQALGTDSNHERKEELGYEAGCGVLFFSFAVSPV